MLLLRFWPRGAGASAVVRRGGGGARPRLVRGSRQPSEPLTHPGAHAVGQAFIDDLRAAIDDPDPVLFLKSKQRLDEQERASSGLLDEVDDMFVRLAAQ